VPDKKSLRQSIGESGPITALLIAQLSGFVPFCAEHATVKNAMQQIKQIWTHGL
jgi:hypothetical protein